MAKYFIVIIIVFAIGVSLNAQDKIETDRPDQTELATLTPLHYFQAEFGYTHESFDNSHNDIHPHFLFKYGLTKNFEIRLQDQFITQSTSGSKTTTGFAPPEIGFRLALFQQKKLLPTTALITHFTIPTFASKKLQADHVAPAVFLAMENDVTKKISLSYNAGAEWDGFSIDPAWIYSLSCGFELSEKWESFVEIFGNAANHTTPENSIDAGFGYYISNDVKADASAGVGISKMAANYFVGAGISFRIK